ncbi:hypothetical protein [Deinococcus ruber]|uniref:Uncharacterized protein n=1 Tax=Deinococcus ruber TaxID=1848197 RepID=A0A918F6H1_9DEIO|nr:hypothetical protein [Deinococcus ruber]GGR13164.1 hypothetical protein GCM10008957_27650 [Deinococcus ruber]
MTTTSAIRAIGGARLCGSGRKAGELYLECGVSAGGQGIEAFLQDLPLQIDQEAFNISPLGVTTFLDPQGVTHVLDWVGEGHYPEVADFIEEARLKGVSRKISHTAPISGLTQDSRLFLVHPRAAIVNTDQLPTPAGFHCPCGHRHTAQQGCLGWAWHALPNDGQGKRKLAESRSYAVKSSHVPKEAEYALAVFMVVPITALTVIVSPDTQTLTERLEQARLTGIPVLMADE